ncbi:SDR family NAD(P)-dependent oxidoreductase [Serratia sp. TSA_198.1]|jgi:NAD(P)-dependent dehydrogenase (short-subunit alcohol dehydrogenase family)|uniref:3-oxoacyl-[acyl-carrier-protein] reductase FabG n=1 Tax=Serratia plymuthica TaxID=82996 RepID=A0A2X4TPX1_SERPL|nr:SDR family oxidoreductase [Serratia plymuthica]QPS23032.1 SDR family oxidoreductase [Serratia plymuthica]QPS64640.1 SDR family oxidoreductase [Serratia plymuthica]RKS62926.1 NAD(P)-dependent dehydrogenase (short-subunit alcohol dehydrogenase family) [Serratia plymuthica]CAI2494234.1 3-oxoacyl-[acyl-carrier-protein] reductase FabG [Serratia plymuthica]SQI29191.1 3-oxoacyl-[acyl-carrier-protein] reductase FabG [Serratia plymuthica]
MELSLSNKIVLITGAASGIGASVVSKMLEAGANVVGADINPVPFEAIQNRKTFLPLEADLAEPNAAQYIVDETIRHFDRIDVLINNAAVIKVRNGFLSVKDENWLETFNLNFLGYVRTARAALPHMLAQKSGVIIHTASEASVMPNPLLPDYSVFKAAVVALSKALSREFTPLGIRSNVVSPGFIRTAVYDAPGGILDTLAEKYGTDRESALEQFLSQIGMPAGRLGTPEEVADLILYLASEKAAFMSGSNILMEGGIVPTV